MSDTGHPDNPTDPSELPFVAPCRTLSPWAPVGWVRRGWDDARRAPLQSLGFGAVILFLSFAVVLIAWDLGGFWLEIALLSTFVFIAPVLAVSFYAVSAELEKGRRPSFANCLLEMRRPFGNLMMLALVLMVVSLLWARAATVVEIFFPEQGHPDLREMLPFLAIGSAVGSVFALITFTFCAFSIPMLMDCRIDAITAVVTSVNAVLRNKAAMVVWVALIVAAVGIGFATALFGLAVTMPVIGHATWHAYRETINTADYPHYPPDGT